MALTARLVRPLSRQVVDEIARGLIEAAPDAMIVIDDGGTIVLANVGIERMFDYDRDELIGASVETLVPERLRTRHASVRGRFVRRPALRPMGTGLALAGRRRDGSEVPVEVSLAPVKTSVGTFVAAAIRDVSERQRHEERLRHMADHDSLTGLFNRRRFAEELERELARARRSGSPGAVLLLDLDHFKGVNDTLGHPAGDELLRVAAAVLSDRMRSSDVVARMGGDEFAVILPATARAGAEAAAKTLVNALRAGLPQPSRPGTRPITASVGIAPFASAAATSVDELLAEADVAMYEAKRQGRDRTVTYDPDARGRRLPTPHRSSASTRLRANREDREHGDHHGRGDGDDPGGPLDPVADGVGGRDSA